MKLLSTWALACLAAQAVGAVINHKLDGWSITEHPDPVKRAQLQKYVSLLGATGHFTFHILK